VGNEALVDWTDHMVSREAIIAYVRAVKAGVDQPVTVADNYAWWVAHGAPLARELDFVGVHTYPFWLGQTIDEALAESVKSLEEVHAALPESRLAILEAGWATAATEFPEQANPANQTRYLREMRDWAETANVTVFFFEAFDEPWKGDPNNPLGAEKNWGLFTEDRKPKPALAPTGAE